MKYAETDADARLRNNAIAKLIEDNAFEIPTALIENQARNLLNNFAEDLQQRGVDLSKVESQFVEMAYNNMRTQAERDVRGALLLDKVAELEKVDVSETEINEEIQKLADYYRASAEEIRESLEMAFSLPESDIAPIEADVRKAGPGHYVVPSAQLGVKGTWQAEAAVRLSRFNEVQATFEVPVR